MMKKVVLGYALVIWAGLVLLAPGTGIFESYFYKPRSEWPMYFEVIIFGGVIGGFILWFWMLADYFKGRPMEWRVAMGFFMIFMNIIAAIVYFLFIYAPYVRKDLQSSKQKEAI